MQLHTRWLGEEWGTTRVDEPKRGDNVTVTWDGERFTAQVLSVDNDLQTVTVTYPGYDSADNESYPWDDLCVRWYHVTNKEWLDAYAKLKAIVKITDSKIKTKLQVYRAAIDMVGHIEENAGELAEVPET
jgi:hypothetical protein